MPRRRGSRWRRPATWSGWTGICERWQERSLAANRLNLDLEWGLGREGRLPQKSRSAGHHQIRGKPGDPCRLWQSPLQYSRRAHGYASGARGREHSGGWPGDGTDGPVHGLPGSPDNGGRRTKDPDNSAGCDCLELAPQHHRKRTTSHAAVGASPLWHTGKWARRRSGKGSCQPAAESTRWHAFDDRDHLARTTTWAWRRIWSYSFFKRIWWEGGPGAKAGPRQGPRGGGGYSSAAGRPLESVKAVPRTSRHPSPACAGCRDKECPAALFLVCREEADVQDMLLRCPCLAGARLRQLGSINVTTKQLQDDGVVTALAHGFRCHLELLTDGGRKVS